jgi:hypothetical protein
MVRAGVVTHPVKWLHSGYHEIQEGELAVRDACWSEAVAVGSLALSRQEVSGFGYLVFLLLVFLLKFLYPIRTSRKIREQGPGSGLSSDSAEKVFLQKLGKNFSLTDAV